MNTMAGLSHGCKPPSQKPRTMAAVSPLHQPLPPAYEAAAGYSSASRTTSSFAAALRKLAKQAGDPVAGEKDLSPVSSPVLSQGSLTPKRSAPQPAAPQPIFLTNHQGSFASSSPPVVTIAPSRPLATHTSESRKVMDLSNVQQANSTGTLSNGHMQDSLGVKLDSSKGGPRPSHSEKWEDSSLSNKGLSASSASSQVRPHATIAPLPRPDDSLTSSRGFQPYRGGAEEPRNTLPHHLPSLFDHHHPSYPYSPAAFLPPPHLSHPAYRFDDPLYLERYSLLRPPVMPYPQAAGMMGPPFYPNSRYAADLIAQSLSISSANSSMLNHERLKLEEERRMREKEMELDQSRNKEQERLREKEHKEKEHKEREQQQQQRDKEKREKSHREKDEEHHKKGLHNSNYFSSKRTESPSVRNTPVIHCTPNHSSSAPTAVPSTAPLNLVVQPEPLKKETTELWMPWQQPAPNYAKDTQQQQEVGHSNRHQTFRPQEVHRSNSIKDSHINEKVNLRFSPTILNNEKKHSSNHPHMDPPPPEPKKHSTADSKRFDSLHHHISELSSKEQQQQHGGGHHEWRHEKLQKAATNNHRKSHESKKAKEERSNHVYQNHQRKVANGAILKPTPYPTEGMHARLLEAERCRMELNGYLPKVNLQSNGASDRLVVPGAFKASGQVPGKEVVSSQKSFSDFHPTPLPRSNVNLTPVVSKLDLDAKNLKKNDFKYCDDDAKEELRLKNFLILTKVPPVKLDCNPQKLKFLRLLGLTTHFKRKKIEFDMYLKRRKILREDSEILPLSPEDSPSDPEEAFPAPTDPRAERLAERLQAETEPLKLEFLFKIGLSPITMIKKEEKERIRRIVEEEKIRRHYRMLAKVNRKSSPRRLFVPKSEAAQKLDHLRKLREMNSVSNGPNSKRLHEDDVEMNDVKYTPSQLLLLKVEQVPYHCSSESSEPQNLPTVPSERPISSYSSSHKSFNKYSFKRGHSLKSEFRFVAPEPVKRNNHSKRVHQNGVDSKMDISGTSIGTQVDPSLLGNSVDRTLADLKNPFNWPGLEAIMEAFYKHQNEQSSEKTVLTERWQQLRQTQEDLKKDADNLTRQMSDLLRTKRELDEERQKHQHALDHIKQCLHTGR